MFVFYFFSGGWGEVAPYHCTNTYLPRCQWIVYKFLRGIPQSWKFDLEWHFHHRSNIVSQNKGPLELSPLAKSVCQVATNKISTSYNRDDGHWVKQDTLLLSDNGRSSQCQHNNIIIRYKGNVKQATSVINNIRHCICTQLNQINGNCKHKICSVSNNWK